jgi:hypothetical protein
METINRREYHAPFPNAVWHIDGHHKLGNFKFVIHGGMDGNSRLVTFMAVSDNNRATTVKDLFVKATENWGCPQRVRADHGGENVQVQEVMEFLRGTIRCIRFRKRG